MLNEITSIIPSFNSMSKENKFDFIFSCEECDILLTLSEMNNKRNNYNVNI